MLPVFSINQVKLVTHTSKTNLRTEGIHRIATVLHPIDRHYTHKHTHIHLNIWCTGMPRMHAARMLFRPSCLVHSGPALL